MKITTKQLRRIIRESLDQGRADRHVGTEDDPIMIIVDWDDDGAGEEPRVALHPDVIQDWNSIAKAEGEEAANEAVTEMLTDETGYLVNGWSWM